MSWQATFTNAFLRVGKFWVARKDFDGACRFMRWQMNDLAARQAVPGGVRVERTTLAGVPCEWVWHERCAGVDPVVLYFHGGGYVAGCPASHRDLAWRLSRSAGARILMVDYRLTPEHPYPAPLDDALGVYRAVLDSGQPATRMAFAGDSAGGNLVLATLLGARDAGLALPAAAICLSPWADLTHSGISIQSNASADALLPAQLLELAGAAYVGEHDPRSPLISPVFADFHGLPPLQIHVGADEILLDDSARVAERAEAAGVTVDYRVWPGVPHAFPVMARLLPEARAAIEQMGRFTRSQWS